MSRHDIIRRIVERELQSLHLTEEAVLKEEPELHQAACALFGTWETALRYAGIRLRKRRAPRRGSRPWVLRRIRRLFYRGGSLALTGIQPQNQRLYQAAVRHFGGWRQALTAAGIPEVPPPYQKWDAQRVIKTIQALAGEGTLFRNKVDKRLQGAANRYFGSWRNALRAAGVKKPDGGQKERNA